MTDHLKQSISALLDEEASEIEVHRLLREFGDDDSLKLSWIRYQQIRAVSQGQHHLSEAQHLSLHDRISQAVQMDEGEHEWTETTQQNWRRPAAGFAVAASLVVAVLVGINFNQPMDVNNGLNNSSLVDVTNPVANPLSSSAPFNSAPIDVQTVSTAETDIAFSEDEPDLRELDEVKQQQLREYLMRHDRMSQMNTNSRTVNYQPTISPTTSPRTSPRKSGNN